MLAYLRRDDKETILVVVNLSRAVQPAELDLKSFAGLIPVEMNGLTEFPSNGATRGNITSEFFRRRQLVFSGP